ncbi:MAG: glutamate racemase [Anaerofustis sp.]
MDRNLPIGILDSGVGGLTAVVQMNKLLPNESVIYFGDSKRMPYGNRENEEIIDLANRMIAYLERLGVKAILLACNTISSQLPHLKSSVPLFSIVEAGAKSVVCASEGHSSVGVIATCATVKNRTYESTIHACHPDVRVISNSSVSLPKIIDSELDNVGLLADKIKECVDPILQKDPHVKYLLLGCSHFPIIKREIGELYPDLIFLDPAKSQVSILRDYLEENNLQSQNPKRQILLYTTAETYEYAAAIKRLKLEIDMLMKVKLLEEDE